MTVKMTQCHFMAGDYLIYMHTAPNGKSYIGQTNNLHRRNIVHKNTTGCRAFSSAIKKYGWESFTTTILAEGLSLDEANRLEAELIEAHNTISPNGYNLRAGGNAKGFSEETRAKLAALGRRRKLSEQQRQRLSELGKAMPRERIEKMVAASKESREKRKGEPHHNLGRKHGEEHRLKTSEASKARWQDPDYRIRAIAATTGRKNSLETKAKMAASARARWERQRKEKEAAQGDLLPNNNAR